MTHRFAPVAALFQTDAYKLAHIQQYLLAGDVSRVYSNYTNRKSRIPGIDKVVHFGLQAAIQKHLVDAFEPFFAADEDLVASLYEERLTAILGPNTVGSDHIRALHRKGYLPLKFSAVLEGTLVPIGVPSFTVENTEPEFFWLTNYVETVLSSAVWSPSTSATIANHYRGILERAATVSGEDPSAVDFQCHDFSYRGMSSSDSAASSGAAHLLSFTGSDSLVSFDWIDRYYGGHYVAMSVPATEHSVMCTGIEKLGEQELFKRLLDLYPSGLLSVVSDTFDLWRVLTEYLPALKDQILARDGKLVIRPDSGDPEKIICGDPDAPFNTPAYWGVVRLLELHFGSTTNKAGYRVLDSHVGVMYGDSITPERAKAITDRLRKQGYASTNVVFGVGSFTYQYNTRDTFGSAMKATWAEVDGEGVNLLKDPITDDGTKKSATGRLAVLDTPNGLVLKQKASHSDEQWSLLEPVWQNGKFVQWQSFSNVRDVLARERAH